MERSSPLLARLLTIFVTLALVFGGSLSAPVPHAYADDDDDDDDGGITLFSARFESAPLGPLTGALNVETGAVRRQSGSVEVVSNDGNRAVRLDAAGGRSEAVMLWANYPGGLPGEPAPAVRVDIRGTFAAGTTASQGASLGLLVGGTAPITGTTTPTDTVATDATFFELFTFGAGGQLTRDGSPTGLSYAAGRAVKLDARILLPGGSAGNIQIKLDSGDGQRTIVLRLPETITADTLNRLSFRAPAGGGRYTADDVRVRFEREEEPEDDDPPARIEIDDDDVTQEIEIVNGVTFINLIVVIANGGEGGKARGAFLVIDLEDLDDLELAEVGFPEGAGFVREIRDGRVYIGLGRNNIIFGDGRVKVKVKFKVNRLDIRVNARMTLTFRDTSGSRAISLPPVAVVVPAVPVAGPVPISGTVPITGTQPISGTVPITGTQPITRVVEVVRLPIERIDVRFQSFWRARGGLVVFGLPLSEPLARPDGIIVQYFERARLEYHPRNAGTPYVILIGRLGAELGFVQPPAPPPTSTVELRWYFPTTGHLIAEPFRSYWQSRGGLLLFGLPISAVRVEDGLTVQYFERARLELHPDLRGTPFEVQIGLLGVDAYQADDDDDD